MTISLLLTTYNNPLFLELVFQGIMNQTRKPDEILIGDDGSTDETRQLIESFRQTCGIPIIHVWQEDRGFRKTRIMNKAIACATGDYIVQIDGDILMHPKFVEDHANMAHPNCFIRGSRIRLNADFTAGLTRRRTWSGKISMWSKGIYRHREKAIRVPLWLGKALSYCGNEPGWALGCNFSFWRQNAIDINGYDEFYEGWGAEDQDFAARLLMSGCRGIHPFRLCVAYHLFHEQVDTQYQPKLHEYYLNKMGKCEFVCKQGLKNHL